MIGSKFMFTVVNFHLH